MDHICSWMGEHKPIRTQGLKQYGNMFSKENYCNGGCWNDFYLIEFALCKTELSIKTTWLLEVFRFLLLEQCQVSNLSVFLVCDVCLVCVLRARTYHDGATPTAGEAPFNTFDQSCLATMRCRRKTFLLARNSQAKCIWIHAASKPRERSKCERALVLFPKLMDFEKLQGLGREYISFGIYNAIYFGMYRFWNISTLVYIGIYNAIF